MKAKIVYLTISTLCLSGIMPTVYAEVGEAEAYGSHHRRHEQKVDNQPEARIEHQNLAISIKVPGITAPAQPSHAGHHRDHEPSVQWVPMASGQRMPANAVVGGYQHDGKLYVCQAKMRGGIYPGKVVARTCHISHGGREMVVPHYQVLVSRFPLNWRPASFGTVPHGAIEGGFERGHPLFICQARYRGGIHPGKITGQHCSFGWSGKEVSTPHYNVLVR